MEKIINKELVYDGHLKVYKLTVEFEGKIYYREVVSRFEDYDESVAAFVFNTKTEKAIFIQQFRAGTVHSDNHFALECVAGTLKKGEDPTDCIKREIEEEIGYKTDSATYMGVYYMAVGSSAEKIHLYMVEVSEKVADGGGLADENERIDLIEYNTSVVLNLNTNDLKTQCLIERFKVNYIKEYYYEG